MSELNLNIDPPERRVSVRRAIWLTLLGIALYSMCIMLYIHFPATPALIQKRKEQAFPGQSKAIFETASQITLYLLNGSCEGNNPSLSTTSLPGRFHGYQILGQTVLNAADRKRVVAAIYSGFAERRTFRHVCGFPHYGLRAVRGKQSVDLVISFYSSALETFSSGARGRAPISHAPQECLNRLLDEAGFSLG